MLLEGRAKIWKPIWLTLIQEQEHSVRNRKDLGPVFFVFYIPYAEMR